MAALSGYNIANLELKDKDDLAIIGPLKSSCSIGLYGIRTEAGLDLRFKEGRMRVEINNIMMYEENAYGQTLRTYGPSDQADFEDALQCLGSGEFTAKLTKAVRGEEANENW